MAQNGGSGSNRWASGPAQCALSQVEVEVSSPGAGNTVVVETIRSVGIPSQLYPTL